MGAGKNMSGYCTPKNFLMHRIHFMHWSYFYSLNTGWNCQFKELLDHKPNIVKTLSETVQEVASNVVMKLLTLFKFIHTHKYRWYCDTWCTILCIHIILKLTIKVNTHLFPQETNCCGKRGTMTAVLVDRDRSTSVCIWRLYGAHVGDKWKIALCSVQTMNKLLALWRQRHALLSLYSIPSMWLLEKILPSWGERHMCPI